MTFKERYADPEYRKYQRAKLMERIKCECGKMMYRSNSSKHRKSIVHTKRLNEIKLEEEKRLNTFKDALDIDKFKDAMNCINKYIEEHNLKKLFE